MPHPTLKKYIKSGVIILKNPRERIIAAIITLLLIFALFSLAVIASGVSVSAKSAALYEPRGEKFYYTKSADTRLPMASTTKIMTALVAIENATADMTVSVAKEAVGVEGSSLYLKAGECFTLRDLLYGLMLRSANDAAEAIAYAVGGSLGGFVDMMNAKANALSLHNTHFDNPHGLDGKTHYTTARELAILTAAALENPLFREITSTYKTVITNSEGEERLVVNHNKLLSQYEGCIGVKTGYTKKCGRCLVSAAERDGVTLISVTLSAPDDWNDHKRMLDYGFSLLERVKLIDKNEVVLTLPTTNGIPQSVTVGNRDELYATLPITRPVIERKIITDSYLTPPIDCNKPVGQVVFYLDGVEIGRVSLYPWLTDQVNLS